MLRKIKNCLRLLQRKMITPTWPKSDNGKLWLHIGCGKKNYPGFVNIDAMSFPHVHIIKDNITQLDEFKSSSVDLIYMCHILEHFKRDELKHVLKEMLRLLKPSGVLRLSVPDFDKLLQVYNAQEKDINAIHNQLMGGQDNQYNIHYTAFTEKSMHALLTDVGFADIQPWDAWNCDDFQVKDRAIRELKVSGAKYPISLNIDAIK